MTVMSGNISDKTMYKKYCLYPIFLPLDLCLVYCLINYWCGSLILKTSVLFVVFFLLMLCLCNNCDASSRSCKNSHSVKPIHSTGLALGILFLQPILLILTSLWIYGMKNCFRCLCYKTAQQWRNDPYVITSDVRNWDKPVRIWDMSMSRRIF